MRQEVEEYPREVTDAAAGLFTLLPRVVPWLIQRYIEQIVTSGIADSFEEVLASRELGPTPQPADPPAVVFVDISGYTNVNEQQGDAVAVRMATTLQLQLWMTAWNGYVCLRGFPQSRSSKPSKQPTTSSRDSPE